VLLGWALFGSISPAYAEPAEMSSWPRRAAEAWLTRARASLARGDTANAISAYTEALRVDPNFGDALLELAEIRMALGDTQQTEWLLSRAASLRDSRARGLLKRARFYTATGRAELALADLSAAAANDPPSAEVLRELAAHYVRHRAWVAALAVQRRLASSTQGQASADDRRDAETTLQALAALAAEADAAQHALPERGWVRAALRRHAAPARVAQRGAPLATRGTSAAARPPGDSERKLAP
jgi:tetratricopeptide (TPR) repeat protein